MAETTPWNDRTRAQLDARAHATARYRTRQKAMGVPNTAQINAEIASAFLTALARPAGLHISSDRMDDIAAAVIKHAGWQDPEGRVLEAVRRRVSALTRLPKPIQQPEKHAQD